MKKIKLSQGLWAIVDDADFEELLCYKWCASRSSDTGGVYACRFTSAKNGRKKRKVYMHRFIMDCNNGLQVDHINDDTLDNRRSNLQVLTQQGNIAKEWMKRR